jgi:hypothetical protein
MKDKKRYNALDEIGFVGTQDKRTSKAEQDITSEQ